MYLRVSPATRRNYCRCSVFRCPLYRRKTTHKITNNQCWLFDLEPHAGRYCPGQFRDQEQEYK